MAEDRFAGSSSKPAQMRASFLGRLATYRYMDMEAVIGEALDFSDQFVASRRNKSTPPIFPNKEA
jgi:UDP-galactopyranose mutase